MPEDALYKNRFTKNRVAYAVWLLTGSAPTVGRDVDAPVAETEQGITTRLL